MNQSKLALQYFQFFPSKLNKRSKSLNSIFALIQNIQNTENGILISGQANNYNINILIEDETIKNNSPIKVNCDCSSFKFEFAYALSKQNALLNPENYIIKAPKKPNHNIISGCKHIIKLCRIIYKETNHLNKILKKE